MKHIVILLSLGLLLASCGASQNGNTPSGGSSGTQSGASATQSGSTESGVAQKPTDPNYAVKDGDTVSVDYVGKLENGDVFDSSIKEEAKKSKNYSESRTYEPFTFTAKEGGGTIAGFWKGVIGMKVGEKKTITISPEDGYGTEWQPAGETTVKSEIFDKTLVKTIDRAETQDYVKTQIDRALLEKQGRLPVVGDELSNDQGIKAKVTAIGSKTIDITIDNSRDNPFHGKKIAVGTELTYNGNSAVITKVTADKLTLKIDNKTNPFYGKTLEAGLTGIYKSEQGEQRMTIKKVDGANVTVAVEVKNPAPLAGKTLIFDLDLKEIKSTAK